ncbi:ABC transporter ATP-binding protein [Actinocorallia sp. B10E7]|uniref:ABC transporter ATP-binding protein n=1 Tax=Actinocorallia sp. B10E7 TaxID=3153558 RepID=UPI00325CA86F
MVVEFDGVVRTYGGGRVIGPVSLALAPGEGVALTGPNGSGKSTLLRVATGVDRADEGTTRVLGGTPRPHDPEFRRRVLVLDEVSYFPDLSVREHLMLVAVGYGLGRAADGRVDEVLEECRLAGHRDLSPYKLSSGLRQLMALAAMLLPPEPELLVLDEPERHLDDSARAWLAEVLAAGKRSGTAVLFASHSGELVRAVADRVVKVGEKGGPADG